MSCSTTPHVIIDDDDEEFDWEAAVKEIDVACEKGAASTSYSTPRKPSAPRQSTLDRFVQNRHHTVNNNQNRHQTANNHDEIIGDGVAGCYCKIDMEAAKTWIYPVNIPLRDYQLSITKTALFSNTLVALPTGLGKTFIAAVVMYNYFRWFPEGKIVFTAPSRPLVMQQIEACHNIVGIPQEWTIDLTGQTSPDKRENLWKNKRVFFATPQVFEKDIQSGTCSLKYLVCLVIDEAHRALGNYSYCVAVRELMAAALHFRILALTATPGSKQQTIQKVIDNLQISHLEYRKEGDHDVSPYVHDRKLELITVAMGKDAVEISDMLLESIRPLVNKLSSYGVLFNRDFQTLSPLDLLNARERFRTAPPVDLSHVNCDDADGILGVLITLYHVRKLLSSHGIKPAYEMLESKLKQGYILKYMSRNEAIRKTKLLMEQNLSHGAPNPKLVKMTEILIDHFRTNDPKNSRVIIFSNFRGSVRDIMNSLSSIGESIKATEFIGQSSGKNLKGQTQKIQQAVLQKFRAGGYNIIVATSIGEEGLDIMEVDLVICFDANISPLRMIQRMGRTGRKHDGRVVVLACEGSELKGYMRKQANSKAVNKHMRNGGINSFVFHSSPRMIPHICKPEVRFHEFKIEQFVPRGKKTKDGCVNVSTLKEKLSDAEAELIAKYYPSSGRYTWKPSLNAFPHFQTFPSKVYKIKHSFRTRILIGTMQHLQALSFSTDTEVLPAEIQNKTSSDECMGGTSLQNDTSREDFICFHDSSGDQLGRNISAMEEVISRSPEEHQIPDPPIQNTPVHCYLFGDTYVSVNTFGAVSIALVPSLPFLNKDALSKSKEEKSRELMNTVECNPSLSRAYSGHTCKLSLLSEANIANPAKPNCSQNCLMSSSPLLDSKFSEPLLHTVENVVLTPSPKRNCRNSEAVVVEEFTSTRRDSIEFTDLDTCDVRDMEMSPRLTNMIEKGVVPESPLAVSEIGDHPLNGHTVCKGSSSEHLNSGLVPSSSREVQVNEISKEILQSAVSPNFELRKQLPSPSYASIALGTDLPLKELSSEKTGNAVDCNAGGLLGYTSHSPINKVIHTPVVEMTRCGNVRVDVSGSPIIVGVRTPLNNLTNSYSNDWRLSSAESSKSIKQAPKFRRLRKLGESKERISTSTLKDNSTGPISNLIESTTRQNRVKGKRKIMTQAKLFIEEEAEVSSDAAVSDDEEEDNGSNSNEDSFIDDRINPTMESTQAECDMMAIYRRSLLSQFSMESPPCCSTDLNTSSTQCRTEGNETERSSSGKNSHSLQTPQTVLRSVNQSPGKNSHSLQTPQTGLRSVNQLAERGSSVCQIESNCIPSMYMLNEARTDTREERQMESRKRKLSFHQVGYDPVTTLQPQRLFHSEATGETPMHCQPENNGLTGDIFSDDQFYEGLDLDELEAQATELLRHKSELSIDRKHMNISDPLTKINPEISHSPSFDLGI